jgi:hypothetical protein
VSGAGAPREAHADSIPIGGLPVNPLQIEIIANHRRETLMREAEMQCLADMILATNQEQKLSDPRPQRRGLAMLWPRLATHAS